MKLFKTLANPFLLVAEGFAAGALLFLSAAPQSAEPTADSARQPPGAAELRDLQGSR